MFQAAFLPSGWRHTVIAYLELTKPRVVMLAAFCAVIGMLLATDEMVPVRLLLAGTAGISLLAGAGFVFNCLVERSIDARMARTRARPKALAMRPTSRRCAKTGSSRSLSMPQPWR